MFDHYFFLFLADEPECWWYEFYDCIVRLSQTAMTVFILPGSNEAIAIQIVLAFIFVKVHGTKKPYLEWKKTFLVK